MEKTIFHIDVNNAYLSWEAVHRLSLGEELDLRTIPSAIAGDQKKRHGIILAKSPLAKQYGVRTGEPIVDALKKCPNLTLVPPNHRLYEEKSKAFMDVLMDFSPVVEQFSIDEAFCDMTGTEILFGPPLVAAEKIRKRIEEELKFSVNIGISTNKLLAKMASDYKNKNQAYTLYPHEIREKMWPLPVRDLLYVGKSTERILHNLGIRTIGQLANMDIKILRTHLKKHGELIHNFANGVDTSIISQEEIANKGYGNSTTIPFDVDDESTARMILLTLAETVATRLRKDNVKANMVAVGITDPNFRHVSHQMTLQRATNSTDDIYRYSCNLFDELWDGKPIRSLGIQTSKVVLEVEERQLSLFGDEINEKKAKLDKAIDEIRNRFGDKSVQRASISQYQSMKKDLW